MRAPAAIRLALVVVLAGAGACNGRLKPSASEPPPAGAGTPQAGGSAPGGSGAAGSNGPGAGAAIGPGGGSAGNDCKTSLTCGLATRAVGARAADVLVLLDRSTSMISAWKGVTAALADLISRTQGQINWGLKYLSSDGACGTWCSAEIAPAPNNAAAILASMAAASPGGGTPLRFALDAASAYLTALPDGNPRFILLATDGAANCCTNPDGSACPLAPATSDGENTAGDVANAIAAVAATYGAAGIPVFVFGVNGDAAATRVLNSLAVAGGAAQPPDTFGRRYYPDDDPAALDSAVMLVPATVSPCMLTLPGPPLAPTNVGVLLDGSLVPQDRDDGWSYGPGLTTILLNGAACSPADAGSDREVQVVFGCADPPIRVP